MNPFHCFFPRRTATPAKASVRVASPPSSQSSSIRPLLHWPFGLEHVRLRVPPSSISRRQLNPDDEILQESQHGGVMPIVDLDEVTDDLYRGSVFALEALEGHPGHIVDALVDEEKNLENHPLDWLNEPSGSEVTHHAAAGFGLNIAMLPLSAMAIHAGWHETRHGLKHLKRLKQRKTTLEAQQKTLSSLETSARQSMSQAERHLREQLLDDLALEKRLTHADIATGVSSTVAGGAIMAKAASEMAVCLGTQALTSHAAEKASTVALATNANLASSLVLGPLSSLSAVALAGFFLYQSKLEKRSFLADLAAIRADWGQLDPATLSPAAQRYHEFLTGKFRQRQRFISQYDAWNTAFAAGTSAYAAGTLTKTSLSAAAIAGTSVAAGPAGLGVLAGLGAVGAATMSISSHQYFLHHNKHKRYRDYESSDMPAIDRRFLVLVEALARRADIQQPDAASNGFELRAALFAHLDGQEKALTQLLNQAANQMAKHPISTRRSTDPRQPTTFPSSRHTMVQEGKAILSASAAYGRHFFMGHPHRAQRAAHQAYATQTANLTKTTLEQWFEQSASWPAQAAFLQTSLELEKKYLTIKLATRQERQHIAPPPPLNPNASATERQLHQAQIDLVEQLRNAHASDRDRLQTITRFIEDIEHLNQPGRLTPHLLEQWRTRFMHLQRSAAGAKAIKAAPSFANWCLVDASKHTRAARGILLAVERQAVRLRERLQTQGPEPSPSVASALT